MNFEVMKQGYFVNSESGRSSKRSSVSCPCWICGVYSYGNLIGYVHDGPDLAIFGIALYKRAVNLEWRTKPAKKRNS